MNQIPLSFDETIHFVRNVSRNLGHPQSVCMARNSSDLHTSCRDLDKEKNDKSLQAGRRSYFDREEVRGDDLFPVRSKNENYPSHESMMDAGFISE
jgi:hypothetical protein